MKENNGNGFALSIAQAMEEMKAEQGENFSLTKINLAELQRRISISRAKLRRLKKNGFQNLPYALKGRKHRVSKLSGYTGLIDELLRRGVSNSSVIWNRLCQASFAGSTTIVKDYMSTPT